MHAPRTGLLTGTALLALVAGCSSDEPTADASLTTAPTTATPVVTTAEVTSPVATTADAPCVVDLGAAAITDAVAQLPPAFADAPDVAWDPTPDDGTYDPCATLSAATVTVDGATGGSPEAVLLFHNGAFVGTATPEPYGLTTLNTSASTADTVAVDYRYVQPGESNADASGLATVRYQWADGAVRVLDTLPPEITS